MPLYALLTIIRNISDVMGIITNVYKIRRFPFAFVKERQIMKHDMLNSRLRKTCKSFKHPK